MNSAAPAKDSSRIRRGRQSGASLALLLAILLVDGDVGAQTSTTAVTPANCTSTTLPGANVAGAEFNMGRSPAVAGRDYIYPGPNEIALLQQLHLRLMRVPVAWERLQPQSTGELDDAEVKRLDEVVAAARRADIRVVVDVHSYGAYRGTSLSKLPADTLPDLWKRLAIHYRAQPDVVFGLMNEPNDIGVSAWANIARDTLAAIRKSGASNVVAVPGTNWDGAHSWQTMRDGTSNANAVLPLAQKDAAVVFEVHQYFDGDYSGTKPTCERADDAVDAIANVGRWARANGVRVLLGEFGVSNQPTCVAALDRAMQAIGRERAAWFGWTYWAAGAWWGAYPFNLQSNGGKTAQGDVLRAAADVASRPCPASSTPSP